MKLLVLFCSIALTLAVTCAARCQQVSLDSWKYAYAETRVSGPLLGPITSATVVRQRSKTNCVQGKTFGYRGRTLWVNKGCRATFNVCQSREIEVQCESREIEVQCESWKYKRATCPQSSVILSARVKKQQSNAPCVKGQSFWWSGKKLIVDHGCRAVFKVILF